MTSYELNEILNKTRRTKEISLSAEQVEEIVNKLEVLEHYRKVKSYIERMYEKPFYEKKGNYKWEKNKDYYFIDYNFENDSIDVMGYECELSIKVEDIEKEIIFYNDAIEKKYQKQKEKEMRKYEEQRKNNPVWYGAIFNGTSGGSKNE